jgi:hypothetical protein
MHFWPIVDFGQRLTFWSTLTKVNPHLLLTIQTWPGPLFHCVIQSSCLLMIFLITSFASKWLCAHHAIWTSLNQRSLALVYPKPGPKSSLTIQHNTLLITHSSYQEYNTPNLENKWPSQGKPYVSHAAASSSCYKLLCLAQYFPAALNLHLTLRLWLR